MFWKQRLRIEYKYTQRIGVTCVFSAHTARLWQGGLVSVSLKAATSVWIALFLHDVYLSEQITSRMLRSRKFSEDFSLRRVFIICIFVFQSLWSCSWPYSSASALISRLFLSRCCLYLSYSSSTVTKAATICSYLALSIIDARSASVDMCAGSF